MIQFGWNNFHCVLLVKANLMSFVSAISDHWISRYQFLELFILILKICNYIFYKNFRVMYLCEYRSNLDEITSIRFVSMRRIQWVIDDYFLITWCWDIHKKPVLLFLMHLTRDPTLPDPNPRGQVRSHEIPDPTRPVRSSKLHKTCIKTAQKLHVFYILKI